VSDIKSRKLYTHVERIDNELAELGKNPGDPPGVDDLSAFDQLHYHATDALDIALEDFYSAVEQNFQSGKLGGLRLCAKRVE
jgi:hypothetical protein